MKTKTALIAGLAVVLGCGLLTSAYADPFTLCVKEKKGKMNRGAVGDTPAKGECKNPNKWSPVTLVQESNLIDLEEDLEEQIGANADAIDANSASIGELEKTVSRIVTSSMIGGDMDFFQQVGDGSELVFLGMFQSNVFPSDFEDGATQNLSASGAITNMYVRSSEPGENNTLTATLRIDKTDTSLTCAITGAATSCNVTECVPVTEGQLISVAFDYVEEGAATEIFDIRWNSRFVENGVCGVVPPPPPDNICEGFECPGSSELICDPEVGLTCEGAGMNCASVECPDGTVLQQCGAASFTCDRVVEVE